MDSRTLRVLATILLVAVGLAFIWSAWHVLVAFLFAIFFAYLIDPIVEFISGRFRIGRGSAIAIVYLTIAVGLAALFLFVGPYIVREGERLAKTAPILYEKISSGQIAWQIGAQHGWSYDTKLKFQQFLASHRETIIGLAQNFGERLARVGSNVWLLLLIPILAVFFLKDGRRFGQATLEVFERRRQREFVERVLNDVHLMLAHYIRTQLTLSALTMGAYVAGLSAMKVPYGLILGIMGGFLEFIPIVGPLVGFLLILGIAVGTGYPHLLILVLFLGVWRGLQDYVNSPRIMGKHLKLHPLAVLFGVLAGAEIGGIIGVYLSVPVMAAFRIFWHRWRAFQRVDGSPLTETTTYTPLPGDARDRDAA